MRAILLLSAVAVGHALRMAVTTPMMHRAPLRLALTPMMGLLSPWFRLRDRGLAAGLAATGGSFAFIIWRFTFFGSSSSSFCTFGTFHWCFSFSCSCFFSFFRFY